MISLWLQEYQFVRFHQFNQSKITLKFIFISFIAPNRIVRIYFTLPILCSVPMVEFPYLDWAHRIETIVFLSVERWYLQWIWPEQIYEDEYRLLISLEYFISNHSAQLTYSMHANYRCRFDWLSVHYWYQPKMCWNCDIFPLEVDYANK